MRLFNNGGFVIVALKIAGEIRYYDQENCLYMNYQVICSGKTVYIEPIWDVDISEDEKGTITLLGFYTIE